MYLILRSLWQRGSNVGIICCVSRGWEAIRFEKCRFIWSYNAAECNRMKKLGIYRINENSWKNVREFPTHRASVVAKQVEPTYRNMSLALTKFKIEFRGSLKFHGLWSIDRVDTLNVFFFFLFRIGFNAASNARIRLLAITIRAERDLLVRVC